MALSSGSSAIWSDINGIYSTLRSVQRKHGLSQTAVPNSAGGRINASDISRLNNAINALNSERHISMRTNVTNPSVGSLIYPGIISTLKSKIEVLALLLTKDYCVYPDYKNEVLKESRLKLR